MMALICNSFDWFAGGSDNTRYYVAEFATDSLTGLWNLKPTDLVEAFEKLDVVELDAPFLSEDAQIADGKVTVIINSSVRRQYAIPRQKFSMHWEGAIGRGWSVMSSADTNQPYVMVVPVSLPRK